jgi:hypothetical protein
MSPRISDHFVKPLFVFQEISDIFNFTFTVFYCREGRGGHSRHDWAGGHGRDQGHQVPSWGQVQPQVRGGVVRIRVLDSQKANNVVKVFSIHKYARQTGLKIVNNVHVVYIFFLRKV